MAIERWPAPVRALAEGVTAAVSASHAQDGEAFDEALARLVRVDSEPLAVVLGELTRDALERTHPDGLDSDDAEKVLHDCAAAAAGWFERFDAETALHALAGALAVDDPEAWAGLDRRRVLAHGIVLIDVLLSGTGRPVRAALDDALAELMRAQTIEMP